MDEEIGIQFRINGRNRIPFGTMDDVTRLAVGIIRRRKNGWDGVLNCSKNLSSWLSNLFQYVICINAQLCDGT